MSEGPNSSRPVDFGGRRERKGCAKSFPIKRVSTRPFWANFPSRSMLSRPFVARLTRLSSKGQDALPHPAARDVSHIADPTQIHDQPGASGMFQEQGMRRRRERSALSSCGDVARPEVRNGRNTGSLGNHCWFGNLERRADGSYSRRLNPFRKVMHCLAVRADHRNVGGTQLRLANDV